MNRLVLCAACFALTAAQPEGWKMTDRFYGFRYEVFGKVQGVNFRKSAQEEAETLGCFGWTQNTVQGTVVGEARCSKRTGPMFEKWLGKGPESATVEKADLKVYEDTKIRFHFSHFRILEDGRSTCFEESPHQCAAADGESAGKEEL